MAAAARIAGSRKKPLSITSNSNNGDTRNGVPGSTPDSASHLGQSTHPCAIPGNGDDGTGNSARVNRTRHTGSDTAVILPVNDRVCTRPGREAFPGPVRARPAGWIKVKTRHTEDCIVAGVTGTLERPVSLLLARFDDRGVLRFVGQTHRVRAERRPELAGMHPTSFSGENSGHPWPRPLPAGWAVDLADRAALHYVPVEPRVVVEVDADTARDGPFGRFRHRCRFVRVRPDLHPSDLDRIVSQRPVVSGGV